MCRRVAAPAQSLLSGARAGLCFSQAPSVVQMCGSESCRWGRFGPLSGAAALQDRRDVVEARRIRRACRRARIRSQLRNDLVATVRNSAAVTVMGMIVVTLENWQGGDHRRRTSLGQVLATE